MEAAAVISRVKGNAAMIQFLICEKAGVSGKKVNNTGKCREEM